MIKRTLYFSKAACLSLKNRQLSVSTDDTNEDNTIPIEDVGFLILDDSRITVTIPLLNALTSNNVAVIICNEKHMPYSMNLPLECNNVQNQLFSRQINASEPLKKQMWKQIITGKISNQGKLIKKMGIQSNQFISLARDVKSGDSTNKEAQAARLYWDLLMGKNWLRGRFGEYPNSHLNYGYAILRAAVARSLVGSGLLPTLGIHHHNKYNAYALADDVMEPYRPYVDDEVLHYIRNNPSEEEISTSFKKQILQILTRDVLIGDLTRPLMVALSVTTSSLSKFFSGDTKKVLIPEFIS